MFGLFKKKEKKQPSPPTTLRDTLLGDLSPQEWPSDANEVHPWSLFVKARELIAARQESQAADIYREIAETPRLESRHYLQAWHFLRKMNIQPPPELANKVYGVVVEVCLATGPELVAGYTDHTARYLHSSGGGVVWEAPDSSLNEPIDRLLEAGAAAAAVIPAMNQARPNPPKEVNAVQICILTPSGIHHGLGTFERCSREPLANAIVNTATALMQALVGKSKSGPA
jgi:hypothetical protein